MQTPHVLLFRHNHRRREPLLIGAIGIHHPYLRMTDALPHAGEADLDPVWRLNWREISTLRTKGELSLVPTVCVHDPDLDSATTKIRAE